MRSYPSCWNKTLTKLGFKRKLRKKTSRDYLKRRSLFESLEKREMLSTNTGTETEYDPYQDYYDALVAAGAIDTQTVLQASDLYDMGFSITGGESKDLFSVQTTYDNLGQPLAEITLKSGMTPEVREWHELELTLSLDGYDLSRHQVKILLAGDDLVQSYRDHRLTQAQEQAGSELGDKLTAEFSNLLDTSKQLASGEKLLATEAEKLDLYSELVSVSESITTATTESDVEYTKAQRKELGHAAALLAEQIRTDLRNPDANIAAAAKAARDRLVADADFGDLALQGLGVNSSVKRTLGDSQGEIRYSVIYEAGRLSISDNLSVNLGQAAVIEVIEESLSGLLAGGSGSGGWASAMGVGPGGVSPDLYGDANDHSIKQENNGTTITSSATYVGVSPLRVVDTNIPAAATWVQEDGVFKFDLSQYTQYVTDAKVTLHPVSTSSTDSEQQAVFLPYDDGWVESDPWDAITARDDTTSSKLEVYGPGGDEYWQVTAAGGGGYNPIQLDVTDEVRRKLRMGDLNFDGARGSMEAEIIADIDAFESAAKDDGTNGLLGNFKAQYPQYVDEADIWERADFDGNQTINGNDAAKFLEVHGILQGDFAKSGEVHGFDGEIDTVDFGILVYNFEKGPNDYFGGDITFDNNVDAADIGILFGNFGSYNIPTIQDKLSLRVYATPESTGILEEVFYATGDDIDDNKKPKLEVIQTPDTFLQRFDATADGQLQVTYSIINEPVTSLTVKIYRSTDGVAYSEATDELMTYPITGSENLGTGLARQVSFQANFSNDVSDDYYLIAKLVSGPSDTDGSNNEAWFAGGAFVEDSTSLHVHGTIDDDVLSLRESSQVIEVGFSNNILHTISPANTITDVIVRAHSGDDEITGDFITSKPLLVHGGEGEDSIQGGGGANKLYGDAGNDIIFGFSGADELYGGLGDDQLYGNAGNDYLEGNGGNDLLFGGYGEDTIDGGIGVDQLFGQDGNDNLVGGGDADLLEGGAGNDILQGGDGDDELLGNAGNDTLYGEGDNDLLNAGYFDAGISIVDGGAGDDQYIFEDVLGGGAGIHALTITDAGGTELLDFSALSQSVDVRLDLQTVTYQNQSFIGNIIASGTVNIKGTSSGDIIYGDSSSNTIFGGDGDDFLYAGVGGGILYGESGTDNLYAQGGSNSVYGGLGDDFLYTGLGASELYGNEGNDEYHVQAAPSGSHFLYEGGGNDSYVFGAGNLPSVAILAESLGIPDGIDTLDFSALSFGITSLTLPGEEQSNPTFDGTLTLVLAGSSFADGGIDIEHVIGTNYEDNITGNLLDNRLEGGNDNDTLIGGGGSDVLLGQSGFDLPEVIDDSDGIFSVSGAAWQSSSFEGGFNQTQIELDASEAAPHTATWLFSGLQAGDYEVYATWEPDPDDILAGETAASFEITGSGFSSQTFIISQQQLPQGDLVNGKYWQRLDSTFVEVDATGNLTVVLSNTGATGTLFADAVRIVKHNHSPDLATIGGQSIAVGIDLNLVVSATDLDGLNSDLTFSFVGDTPAGLAITNNNDGTAQIQWLAVGRPEGKFPITVAVEDLGNPPRQTSETFYIISGSENTKPAIDNLWDPGVGANIPTPYNFTINEGDTLEFDVIVSDLENHNISYDLALGAPNGAGFDSVLTNRFIWTPSEDQDSTTPYQITIQVTDDGNPPLRISQTIQVTVNEVNVAPSLTSYDLLYDTYNTGTASDWITIDPTITGTVTDDGSVDGIEVLFDLDSDGTFEGTAFVNESENDPTTGTFVFEPSELVFRSSVGGILEPLIIDIKVREWDPALPLDSNNEKWRESTVTTLPQINPSLTENTAPVLTVQLLNDTGTVGSPKSVDGIFTGNVANVDGPIEELYVKVYDTDPSSGTPDPIATLLTDGNGNFSFVQGGLTSTGNIDLWFVPEEVTAFGAFEGTAVPFSYEFLANQAPIIDSLGLLNDTGASSIDGISRDPTIVGSISQPDGGPLGGIVVEFDDDKDGDVDGVTVTDEQGNFIYFPTEAETDGVSGEIDARALEWDDYQETLLVSLWLDDPASTHLNPAPLVYVNEGENEAPQALSLQPLFPAGGGALADPTVWGTVSNDNGVDNIVVEFSFEPINAVTEHFESIAGLAITDETGRFEFTPVGLEAGTNYIIYARAIEWDDTLDVPAGGDPLKDQLLYNNGFVPWTSIQLADTPLAINSFTNYQLVFDTGSGVDANNDETSDPTLKGTITYDGDYSKVIIEFDHNGNGIVDGTAAPDKNGKFSYTPAGLADNEEVTIFARARVPDYIYRTNAFDDDLANTDWFLTGFDPGTTTWDPDVVDDWFDTIFAADGSGFSGDWFNSDFQRNWDDLFSDYVESSWHQVTFTLDQSENDATNVASVVLVNPASPSIDPTITGTVSNDGKIAGLAIEIYLNGNSEPDGSAITDEFGTFVYTMQGHTIGINNVVVRVYEDIYGSNNSTYSESVPYGINIDADPSLVFESLALKYGSDNGFGGIQTHNTTVVGSITDAEDTPSLTIQFDLDGNGLSDDEVDVNGRGHFEYHPESLTLEGSNPITTTVRSRIVREAEDDSSGGKYLTLSNWEVLTWDVITPSITKIELKHDTGNVLPTHEVLDRVTTDPTLIGQVVGGDELSQVTIEFDHNGDGEIDGTALTDSNGSFQYSPTDLTLGGWDVRARVQTFDSINATLPEDGWVHITADGNPATTNRHFGFTLVPANPATITGLNKYFPANSNDPRITGTVTDADGTDNLVVEFFLNDSSAIEPSSNPIGSTTVAEDGSFVFTPLGLPFGDSFLVAQVKEWDYASGSELRSVWDSAPSSVTRYDFDSAALPDSTAFTNVSISTLRISTLAKEFSSDPYDPSLIGSVTFDESNVSPHYVEIDVNHDGTIDDVVPIVIDSSDNNLATIKYHFRYRPDLPSPSINVPIWVRPVGSDSNGLVYGDWNNTTVTYDLNKPNVDPSLIVTDANTSYPTITGHITTPSVPVEPYNPLVEFDFDGDGTVDDNTSTDDLDNFTYTFSGLPPGVATFQARSVRYETLSYTDSLTTLEVERTETVTGDWQTFTITLIDPAPQIDVGLLSLVNEVGSATPPEGTDPTIAGVVTSAGTTDLFGLTVEVDQDEDGIADGFAITDETGNFEYTPQYLKPGDVNLNVRAIDPFTAAQQLIGNWIPFNFVLLETDAPLVNSFELLVDEDDSSGFASSAPTFVGTVTRDDSVSILTVEFDHDNDGIVDGVTTADLFGNFSYDPVGLAYGSNLIRARGVAKTDGEVYVGDWTSTFDLSYISTAPPVVSDLVVKDVTTGEISGRVTIDGFGARATVEVAVKPNGGGARVTNGYAHTDSNGFFTYTPKDLVIGNVEIVVLGLLSHSSSATLIEGEQWQPVGIFSYNPDPVPTAPLVINNYRLKHNTGSSNSDVLTADPTIEGEIDFASPHVTIQFSDNAGGSILGTVDIESDGSFEFNPPGLTNLDSKTIHVQYRLWDPVAGLESLGGWTTVSPVSFTFDLSENVYPTITLLKLEGGTILPGGEHIGPEPIFSGQIGNDGNLEGLRVEFDHDGDGVYEGSTLTKTDGSFIYLAQDIERTVAPQVISARVFEKDYFGVENTSNLVTTLSFILDDLPVVSDIAYDPLAGTQGQVLGSVQASVNPITLDIQYQLFGNYDNAPPVPTSLASFVPNAKFLTSPVDSSGNFVIDLALFNLDFGPASVIARVVDDTNGTIGPWNNLHFRIAPTTVTALSVNNFGLVEDTGTGPGEDTDLNTNNPTVEGIIGTGKEGAYAVVEITIDDLNGNDIVRRTIADANGYFTFTSEDLTINVVVDVEARHVVYDPATKSELKGTPSILNGLTLVDVNDAATITGFGLLNDLGANTIDPTVKGTVINDGRVAGLRVEFDADDNDTVDGFTFTDLSGYFEWTPYDVATGISTKVSARVVEWDGAAKEFTALEFDDVPAGSKTTFTLAADGPGDPSMEDEFAADLTAIEHAELEAVTAVVTFMASLSGAAGSNQESIDVGIGSIRLMHRAGVETLNDDGEFTDIVFDFVDDALPTVSNTSVINQSFSNFDTGNGGTLTGDYDFEKIIVDNGDDTYSIDVVYEVRFSSYHSEVTFYNEEYGLKTEDAVSLDLMGVYRFEYSTVAENTGGGSVAITGDHEVTESLDYDYHRVETNDAYGVVPLGLHENHSSFTTVGDYSYLYEELSSPYAGTTTTQPFSYTETNSIESWLDNSTLTTSVGVTDYSSSLVTENGHSLYNETNTNSGTITNIAGVQDADAELIVDSDGNLTHERLYSVDYSADYGGGDSEWGTLVYSNSSQYSALLHAEVDYLTGQSATSEYDYYTLLSNTVLDTGFGGAKAESTYSTEDRSWNYEILTSSQNGLHVIGESVRTYAAGSSTTTYTNGVNRDAFTVVNGELSNEVNYSTESGDIIDNGQLTYSASFNSTSSINENATISGSEENSSTINDGFRHFSNEMSSTTDVVGTASSNSTDQLDNYDFRTIAESNSSGFSEYIIQINPIFIESDGTSSSSTFSRLYKASQVHGIQEVDDGYGSGGTVDVPFRTNQIDDTSVAVDIDSTFFYLRSIAGGGLLPVNQVGGKIVRTTDNDSSSTNYLGIDGKYEGFSESRSKNSYHSRTTAYFNDINGGHEEYGNYHDTASGSTDSIIELSSEKIVDSTTTTTFSHEDSGSSFENSGNGIFSEDSNGHIRSGKYDNDGFGYQYSLSKTTTEKIETDEYSYEEGNATTKSRNKISTEGSYRSKNHILEKQIEDVTRDNKTRASTDYESFSIVIDSEGTTRSIDIKEANGYSLAGENEYTTEHTIRTPDETTRDGTLDSSYSSNRHGATYDLTVDLYRDGSNYDYEKKISESTNDHKSEGTSKGTNYRDSRKNEYDYEATEKNSGDTWGHTEIEEIDETSTSYDYKYIDQENTSDGGSSFDGTVKFIDNNYTRDGDVTRHSGFTIDAETEENSNKKALNLYHWTDSETELDTTNRFEFIGTIAEKNQSSILTGDAEMSDSHYEEGFETDGTFNTWNASSVGYKIIVAKSDYLTDITKDSEGTLTIIDGTTFIDIESLELDSKVADSIVTGTTYRQNYEYFDYRFINRDDRTTKSSSVIKDKIPRSGKASHTEDFVFSDNIKEYEKYTLDFALAPTEVIITKSEVDQSDTTNFSRHGTRETLTIDNEKTTETSKNFRNRFSAQTLHIDTGFSGAPSSSVFAGNGDSSKRTEVRSDYYSVHKVSSEGLATGGKYHNAFSESSIEEVEIWDELSDNVHADQDFYFGSYFWVEEFGVGLPTGTDVTESKIRADKKVENSFSSKERGRYYDEEVIGSDLPRRITKGTYTEETTSSTEIHSKAEEEITGHHSILLDLHSGDAEEKWDIEQSSKRKIEGRFSPEGTREDTVENSRKEKNHRYITATTDITSDDGGSDYTRNREEHQHYEFKETPQGKSGHQRSRLYIKSGIFNAGPGQSYNDELVNATVTIFSDNSPLRNYELETELGVSSVLGYFLKYGSDENIENYLDGLEHNDFNSALELLDESEQAAVNEWAKRQPENNGEHDSAEVSVAGAFASELGYQVADYVVSEMPIIGSAKAGAELLTGKDARGDDIGVLGRIGAAIELLPGGKTVRKATEGLGGLLGGTKKLWKNSSDKVDDVAEVAVDFAGTQKRTAKAVDDVPPVKPDADGQLPILNNVKCFAPETLVATPAGPRQIAEIRKGDVVLAYDHQSGCWSEKKVAAFLENHYEGPLHTIHTDSGEIRTTVYHPFWVIGGRDLDERAVPRELDEHEDQGLTLPGRWVNSHELRCGDVLVGQDGQQRTVLKTEQEFVSGFAVFNLTIDEYHTYAVGPDGVLVHNTGSCAKNKAEVTQAQRPHDITNGNKLTDKQAIERLRRGQDVFTQSKQKAKQLQKKASGGSIEDSPHGSGFYGHFHGKLRDTGHAFFGDPSP